MSHEYERSRNKGKWENPPANISATVRFITRYMARVRRLRFFIKRMMEIRFTATIATDVVKVTANQVMHSDEEYSMTCFLLLLYASHFYPFSPVVRLPLERIWIEWSLITWKRKIGGEQTRLTSVFQRSVMKIQAVIIRRIRKLTFNLQFFKLPSQKLKWKPLFSPVEKYQWRLSGD